MNDFRIKHHPILNIPENKEIKFTWNGHATSGFSGETIASALFASGIRTFGHHHLDGSPQGIFCANGQCSQCLVLADGVPVKACMTRIREGMSILPLEGLPNLPVVSNHAEMSSPIKEIEIPVLIIGGGPAGLSAAIELGKTGVETLLVDDKPELGGKMVLQTHRFFGSTSAVFAGTRGIEIARRFAQEIQQFPSITVWKNSTVLAVFSDQKVGILRNGNDYILIKPSVILSATGAREKFLTFKGNTLPGVMGAGAFQTLMNRDLVKPGSRVFILGGGNVGLITGYHAIQGGMEVIGLAEALPECGGYKVHKDKLSRLGVPIFLRTTIISANGIEKVESVTLVAVDDQFHPISGTETTWPCDTLLIAVGLDPVNEFTRKAQEYGFKVYSAGDSEEIAEASAAIFSGKIRGREIATDLHYQTDPIPEEWRRFSEILRSKPGKQSVEKPAYADQCVMPVIHCTQEIPCDPCSSVCPNGLIRIDPEDIRHIPKFSGLPQDCIGCEKCLMTCPGLAITLVDTRKDSKIALVSIPWELDVPNITPGQQISVVDTTGQELAEAEILQITHLTNREHTRVIKLKAPVEIASRIAGIRVQEITPPIKTEQELVPQENEEIVCRCERVTANEIRRLIQNGVRDLNEIKVITRAGMGACGSKTCKNLILRLFAEEGVNRSEIIDSTNRPLFMDVPLGIFAGLQEKEDPHD